MDAQLNAVDRKADAAFKRIDDASKTMNTRATEIEKRIGNLEARMVAVETNYANVAATLLEVRNDVRYLTKSFYKSGLMSGFVGGGGPTVFFIVWQLLNGAK